ncbi:hypothetical protein AHMF7605_27175 [Adhaeribacter arboris]|uniref:Alpha/beta hydrolase n=1 Tax=Adhaeribacter arboris TaxID=2072846 RepID=A0A2T2YN49_9BACT|nr:hypothetical protein [Adhaeribacter arboris]PSR56916.1 hypothetical protein AHMF7605_27175 [Adhaeribacter arboris]
MKHLLLSLLFLSALRLNAQPIQPIDYGLKAFSLTDSKLGVISFYVDTTGIAKKAPLFIDINGSGGLPLSIYVKGNGFEATANTFTTDILANTKDKYHYVILDKPGTPFCDTVTTTKSANVYDVHEVLYNYKFSDEYTKRLSLQWRVEATKKVISYLIKNKYWDKTKIVAYGYSEGGQVVPTLAVEDKRVTHIASVVGSGLNQFFDGMMGWRIKAAKGEITQQEAQDSIDAGLKNVADVYKTPNATDKEIGGHSYKRWASFCSVVPFEQLRRLTIPIYMVAATADDSSPIYGLDYVRLEFLRLGKTNLTFESCVGCNHYLSSIEDGKQVSHDYLPKILDWVDRN